MYTATNKLRLSKIDQENHGKDRTEETTREHLFYNENGDQIDTGKDMVWKVCDSLNFPKRRMEKVS